MPETAARSDPYPSFRFVIESDALPVAGFTECSGLDLEIETEDYQEGGQNRFIHKLPGRRRQSDIVLRRGIVGRELFTWFIGQNAGGVQPKVLTLMVNGLRGDEAGLKFEIHDAFPIRWEGPRLEASQAAVAMEALTLAHQGLSLSSEPPAEAPG